MAPITAAALCDNYLTPALLELPPKMMRRRMVKRRMPVITSHASRQC